MAGDDYAGDSTTSGVLVVGQNAQGELESAGDRDWFKVYLQAGVSYQFSLGGRSSSGGTLRDPHFYLYDSSGNSLTDNDDSGGKLDAGLVYTPSTSGYYYVAAGGYQDGQTGTYRMAVASYDDDFTSQKPGSLKLTDLVSNPSDSLAGTLEVKGDVDWVKVELSSGTRYTISLQGTDSGQGTLTDPTLYLYDSSGKYITGDDDGGDRRDSQLTYTPTASGTYYLGLAAYQNAGSGTYLLNLSGKAVVDDFRGDKDTKGKLEVGGAVSGELEEKGDRDWFAIELEAGETYYIDLQGSPTGKGTLTDSYLYLYDAEGNKVAFNDDGGQGYNSRVVFTATTSGTYYLGAGGFNDRETGTYSLSVGKLPDSQASASNNITSYGVKEGSLESGYEHDWVSLALEAATTYRIVLESEGDDGLSNSTLELRDSSGGLVAYATESDESGQRSITFTTDQEGSYYVDIGAEGEDDSGRYLLSVVGRQVDDFNRSGSWGDWSADDLFGSGSAGISASVTASGNGSSSDGLASSSQGDQAGSLATRT